MFARPEHTELITCHENLLMVRKGSLCCFVNDSVLYVAGVRCQSNYHGNVSISLNQRDLISQPGLQGSVGKVS